MNELPDHYEVGTVVKALLGPGIVVTGRIADGGPGYVRIVNREQERADNPEPDIYDVAIDKILWIMLV